MPDTNPIEAPIPAKKIRRSFTTEKKLEIYDHTKSTSINDACKKFKIDRKNIR
jgi:hypothetical protein